MGRLLQLLPELEKVSKKSIANTVTEGLLKRLHYIIHELTSLNDSVDLITLGCGINICLLLQLRRQVNNVDLELVDITHKILALDSGRDVLMMERSKVKKVLLKVHSKVERLLPDAENNSVVTKAEAPEICLLKG